MSMLNWVEGFWVDFLSWFPWASRKPEDTKPRLFLAFRSGGMVAVAAGLCSSLLYAHGLSCV